MTKTIINIKKISLIFFILTGLIHFSAAFFIANEAYVKEAEIINRIFTMPFILTGLMYGLSAFRMSLVDPDAPHKILDYTLIALIVITMLGLLALNVLVPDL